MLVLISLSPNLWPWQWKWDPTLSLLTMGAELGDTIHLSMKLGLGDLALSI